MWKKALVIITFILLLVSSSYFILAEENSSKKSELENKIKEYEEKLSDLREQKRTLSSQIQYMDTQIYLTELKIQETEQNIALTQKEISLLNERIEGLDDSLSYLAKILIKRIVQGYKQKNASFFDLLLDSGSANDLIDEIKYQKIAQKNNENLLIQVQQTKLNFEEQKTLREEKKVKLDNLTLTLNNQKKSLDSQKAQKQKLLVDTQNSEATYQRILSQAKAQLSAFKSFIQTSGASSIISANEFGSGSDNAYYSQRDEQWANQTIGSSSENIINVGCLLTSVAMVAKHNGENLSPSNISSDFSRFYGSTAYMSLPWKGVAGRSYHGGVDVDQELQNGNYVIVGVGNCGYGGSHFVVLIKKDGDDYIMHDPIYGPDLKLSSYYSKSFCSTATFK